MRGVSFEIPNACGKYLFELLDDINIKGLTWRIGGGESYFIGNNTLGRPLFPSNCILDEKELHKEISKEQITIKQIYAKAIAAGYKKVAYLTDENDEGTTLIAF